MASSVQSGVYFSDQNNSFKEEKKGSLEEKEVTVIPSSFIDGEEAFCCSLLSTGVICAICLIAGIVLWSVGATMLPMSIPMVLAGKILLGIGSIPITILIGVATDCRVCICFCPS